MKQPIPSSEVLKRYLANECSEPERWIVNNWYNGLDLNTGEHFSDEEENTLLERIQMQISETEITRPKVFPLYKLQKYVVRIAAILVIGFGISYLYHLNLLPRQIGRNQSDLSWVTFKNNKKRIVRYTLPDSTVVWLNPYARISYPALFNSNKLRETSFDGEGFFDVKPDKNHPFVISTGVLKTTVLGTSFNLKANGNEATYEVSVVSGSVKVSAEKTGKTVILKPKQQVVFQKESNAIAVKNLATNNPVLENWESTSLLFNEAPMTEVADKLQRTFDIRIEFANPDIEKCRLKIDFNNQRLPEILEMIETLLGTTYKLVGDRVIFGGEGCQSADKH